MRSNFVMRRFWADLVVLGPCTAEEMERARLALPVGETGSVGEVTHEGGWSSFDITPPSGFGGRSGGMRPSLTVTWEPEARGFDPEGVRRAPQHGGYDPAIDGLVLVGSEPPGVQALDRLSRALLDLCKSRGSVPVVIGHPPAALKHLTEVLRQRYDLAPEEAGVSGGTLRDWLLAACEHMRHRWMRSEISSNSFGFLEPGEDSPAVPLARWDDDAPEPVAWPKRKTRSPERKPGT